jgi:hypothetical protein
VINTWPVEKLLQWLDERGHRPKRRTAAEVLAGMGTPGPAQPPPKRVKATKAAARPSRQTAPAKAKKRN